jgi:transcriptional regulator with XRE-family HTH domain
MQGVIWLSVAQSIQTYLKDHGIKQVFIAEKCGWSKQKTSCIINGRSKMAADDFLAICDVIGVPYDYFNDRLDSGQN